MGSMAAAADLPLRKSTLHVLAQDNYSPWMIRVRTIAILPDSSAKVYSGSTLLNGSLNASNSVVPELEISYFFTKNIAVEAICCITPHGVKATGGLAATGTLGKTILFPPTVLLQYHFTDLGALKPYVGVGVNYSHFFRNGDGANFTNLQIHDS